MNFAIATHNQNKVAEFKRILCPLGISAAAVSFPPVAETGRTFAENARQKAESACRACGMPAIADDSGLSVDALGGAPGIYSARYAGKGATSEDRIRKLLRALCGVPPERRGAEFVCSICCVFPDGESVEAEGHCRGRIASAPRGRGGFGYDPVFLFGDRTFAELSPEEKDRISHRGKALREFAEKLKRRKGGFGC